MAARSENVRALARGLEILRYVNAVGETKAGEIAASLGIPRPSVYRLLQTLEEEGYITFSSSDNRVRVALQAISLGDNYASTSKICEIAAPLLNDYTNKFNWPIDLSLYKNAHMVIQETTHGRSTLSIDKGMIGYPLPMLRTSAGRAYLAHCKLGERDLITGHIQRLGIAEDLPFIEENQLKVMLDGIVKKGFATRDANTFRPETASIAVPIILHGEVVACVSTIWISKAMSMKDAIDNYQEPLAGLAKLIAEKL